MKKTSIFLKSVLYFLPFCILFMGSCVNTKKVAYLSDLGDTTLVASKAGLEPIIQKKDILSITVSSLSNEATLLFNMPNLPMTATAATNTTSQTAGYLVGEEGVIKFPILGKLQAEGLTQKELESCSSRGILCTQ